jgi:hypothetical protein
MAEQPSTVVDPSDKSVAEDTIAGLSVGQLAALVGGSVLLLFLIIFAVYKYCNREEGSYRIDESKNVGPFADLDTPLNGHASGGSGGKRSGKNRRGGPGSAASNKEWFV